MSRRAWTYRRPRRDADGPWLLWSHYHNAWHQRSATGGAAGYTCEIEHAGIFDLKVARSYHSWREGRNEAHPLKSVRHKLEQQAAWLLQRSNALTERLALADGMGRAPSPPVIDGESSRDSQEPLPSLTKGAE